MVTIRNHNVILDAEFITKLHPKILYEIGKICPENQIKFQELYTKKKRSLVLAFICLIFFPGTHYAFLGRWQLQLMYWLTFGGALIWWLVDMFRLPTLVKECNYYQQKKVLMEINSINVFKNAKPIEMPSLKEAQVA